nr:uncharacterized protein LOC123765422 isoform X1 [Procambarus clarkii]XP_045609921.1 uncharacterized protein LOC123765422 isoform X1 [Procambarus clarkii]XP_045609922.1 uncharacterized protein LOC123765422 isoform X1 [Procambarus clarkii]
MVSQLFTGFTQSLPGVPGPLVSPSALKGSVPAPSALRGLTTAPSDHYFIEFTCQDQPVGRVVIKVLEGTGQLGSEFAALLTGKRGFGYKGSRVFACCQNEWILLGDLLYDAPRVLTPRNHDWDPMEDDGWEESREGFQPSRDTSRSADGEASPRILHSGYTGVVDSQDTCHGDVRGAVVAVAADLHLETLTWSLGPQVKICLSDSLIRSGRALGQVTDGLHVIQRLSQMSEYGNFEPTARITISECGSC